MPMKTRALYDRLPAPVRRRIRPYLLKWMRPGNTPGRVVAELTIARGRFRSEQYDEAQRMVDGLRERDPWNPAVLELATKIANKRGELTVAAEAATSRLRVQKTPQNWTGARLLAGRHRETDARWRPTVTAARPGPPPDTRKVLYLAKESRPWLTNGFCTRTHETLRWLRRQGTDAMGVTMPGFPGVLGVEEAGDVSTVEDVVYHHMLPHAGRALESLGFDEVLGVTTQLFAGLVAANRPSLLHIGSGHRGYETALVGDAVARWAGIPWIYEVRSFFETTWTADPRYMESGEYYGRRLATETRMMQSADLVVTLSGPMRDEIIERHRVPPERVRIIPNAVDPARFSPQGRDEVLRARLGLSGTKTLGYVSNLSHPREGQEVLIRAIARMRSQGRTVTGLIVGDGSRRPQLEALADALHVNEHVVFSGSIPFDEVAAYYAQIDLFVVPRIDERAARMVSPLKPFEAMAMRVPLLVADLPALVEIADGGRRAGTFRAGDADSLAAQAGHLLDAPQTLRDYVAASQEWVARERSWEAVARAFSSAYDHVLTSPRIGPSMTQPRRRSAC